jgi:hypothetical protein
MSHTALRCGVFYQMADVIPVGTVGEARVEHFTVDAEASAFTRIRQAVNPGRDEYVPEGRYARLFVGGALVMSDTPMELRSNQDAVKQAHGDVLIGGLGLGVITLPILCKPDVRSVTVIERSPDVAALVVPHLQRWPGVRAGKLAVVLGDVHRWKPSRVGRRLTARYDYVYLDIWSDICVDDYVDHKRLRAKYGRILRRGGKVESWQFERLRELHRR